MNVKFMEQAIALANDHMHAGDGGPFGAVIVQSDRVIAQGWNCVTSRNDPTAHAEVMAIRDACATLGRFELTGCEIYASCEPCPMCLAAIYWARLDRLYYAASQEDAAAIGFDDAFLYAELSRPLAARSIPTEQHLRDVALQVFSTWKTLPGKVPY